MEIFTLDLIKEVIGKADPDELIEYIEQSFTSYSNGLAVVPPVGTLSFIEPPGDVHIKYGYIKGEQYYVIKIASGFYNNPELGLSSSNGLNLVFNQTNGLLEAMLLDEGLLTDIRTALAGAVVAKHFAPTTVHRIGVIGTGIQARLQVEYLKTVVDCREVMLWGRNKANAEKCALDLGEKGFIVEVVDEAMPIAESCNLIITATPSSEPLLPYFARTDNVLITAMGADTRGKGELAPQYFTDASAILMDSRSQCIEHGELHKAAESGIINDNTPMLEIGACLDDADFTLPDGVIIADLTGIATQDMQISKFVLDNIK